MKKNNFYYVVLLLLFELLSNNVFSQQYNTVFNFTSTPAAGVYIARDSIQLLPANDGNTGFDFKATNDSTFDASIGLLPYLQNWETPFVINPTDTLNRISTPSGFLDYVFDNYGNKYNLSYIKIDSIRKGIGGVLKNTALLCTSGYFNLYFESGSGMEGNDAASTARRAVVCQVFSDISAFINSPLNTTGNKVNIWVRDLNQLIQNDTTSTVLGGATPFYNIPSNSTADFGGIADNEIWKTIHSGVDSYTNVVSPLISSNYPYNSSSGIFYHGQMAFNFNNPIINWNTDLSLVNAPDSLYDLYSVVLHEVTHTLGFASLINYDGTSLFGTTLNYYSRYDLRLKNNALTQYLITNTDSCSLYNYHFALNSSILHPGCTGTPPTNTNNEIDTTVCSNALYYSGSTTVPLYTPKCYEPGASLSHFEDECYPTGSPYGNNVYFTMSNANGTGAAFTKRYLKPEERLVLCDLGYNTNTIFGDSANHNYHNYNTTTCAGIDVAGIDDGITDSGSYAYIGYAGSNINITGILSNDYNAVSFECLQDIYYTDNTLSPISGNSSTTIIFNSSVTGDHLLRYVPVSATGQRGNITYINVYVKEANCTPSVCNMINNGSFESVSPVTTYDYNYYNQHIKFNCWESFTNTPDVFSRYNDSITDFNIPTSWSNPPSDTWNHGIPNAPVNDHFAGFGSFSNTGLLNFCESFQTLLNSPVTSNNSYIISFWAKYSNNSKFYFQRNICQHPTLLIGGSSNMLTELGYSYPTTQIPTNVTVLDSIKIRNDYTWHYYSDTIVYNGTINLNNLIVMNNSTMFFSDSVSYIYVDDISLVPIDQDVSLNLPSPLCLDAIIPDMSIYLPPSISHTGTFVGNGISHNGSIYSFNPNSVGVGTYDIFYYYTNSNGCQSVAHGSINVIPLHATVPIITGNSNYCTGIYSTQSGKTNYIWNVTGGTITAGGTTTDSTVTIHWDSTGTHSVSVVFTDGSCTATTPTVLQVTVVSIPPPTITGNFDNCDTITTYTVVNPDSNSDYQWSITPANAYWQYDTTNVSSQLNVTWVENGIHILHHATITVTVTDNNGCSSSDSIIVFPCCDDNKNYVNFHDTSIYTSDIVPNTDCYINGVDTIKSNIILDHNTFYMSPNAKIYVAPGVQFNIDSTSILIAYCGYMWDGIYVNDSSAKIIVTGNSTISDAINGLVSKNGGVIKLDDVNMTDNYNNVQISNYTFSNPYPGYIRNTRFTGTTSLVLPPLTGYKTYSGINCDSVSNFTIGDYSQSGYLNTFKYMQYGIHASNSNIEVYNNEFDSIFIPELIPLGAIFIPPPFHIITVPTYPEGAIYATSTSTNTLTVGGSDDYYEHNTFNNCNTGIYSFQYTDSLNYNIFENNQTGISLVNVRNNSIVWGNTIDATNCYDMSPFTGISIQNWQTSRAANLLVDGNVILCQRTGISMTNVSSSGAYKAIVQDNLIYYYSQDPTNTKCTGIEINNCNQLLVTQNNISMISYSPLSDGNDILGIKIAASKYATIFNNNMTQMGSGIYTTGQLLHTQFECNNFDDNYYGIQFGSASGISNQGILSNFNPANTWTDYYDYPICRFYSDTGGLSNIFNYYYDSTASPNYYPNPFCGNSFPYYLIPIQNLDAPTYCSNTIGPYNPFSNITAAAMRELSLGATVRNQLSYDTLQNVYIAMAREYVYELLLSDTSIIYMGDTSDYTYLAFYNTMQSSDVAHYLNAINAMDTNNLTVAQSELNLIADTNAINHNRIIVDNIYLNTWAQNNYQLTDEQIRTLTDIAYSDPNANGDAVYTARVMLNINPDDANDSKSVLFTPKQEVKPNTVHVYPNPAKESVTIAFDRPIAGEGTVEIWSIMGSRLLSNIIPKGYIEQRVNVSSLTSGIYFYVIKVNGDKFASGKLIILNK